MNFKKNPELARAPHDHAPLAATVSFETDEPSYAVIEIDDGTRRRTIEFDGPAESRHAHVVVAFKPGTTHTVVVKARGADGTTIETDQPITHTTPPAPADFPPIEVLTCDPERREPGLIVFTTSYAPMMRLPEMPGYVVAIDRFGDVVWYLRETINLFDVRRLANGNIVYTTNDYRVIEVDWVGNVHNTWYPRGKYKDTPAGGTAVECENIHHALCLMPSGNFLALSIEEREFDAYPTSESDPDAPLGPAKLIGDIIIEFQPDGTIVNQWNMFDILDPYRICYDSFSPFWVIRGYEDSYDWCHANSIAYDPRDDSMLVSFRHQDAVIKISRATGEIVWIMGDHGNWKAPWSDKLLTPTDGLEWQYHQHDLSITRDGGILLFDNGTRRATPVDPPCPAPDNYSRAVEFSVDERARTVAQTWAFDAGRDGLYYATFVSGAYRLPATDNVFVTFGGIVYEDDGTPSDDNQIHRICVRLVEVTRDDPAETVFELKIEDRAETDAVRWLAFRSEHIASV